MVLDEYLIAVIIPTISSVAVLAVLVGAPNGSQPVDRNNTPTAAKPPKLNSIGRDKGAQESRW